MIQLIQFPWSPFCLVQRRILEFSEVPFKIVNIPNTDRRLVWRLTRGRYYQVPILKDGRNVVFETGDDTQVLAKYLDGKLGLGLFPKQWAGLQHLVWRHIEAEIEDLTFRLNDIYFEEFLPRAEHLNFIRHKERKFGRGCLTHWKETQPALLAQLEARLGDYEQMLALRPHLLDPSPRFVDFNLYGMLSNFLFSGHYRLPARHTSLAAWYERMQAVKHSVVA